MRTEEGSFGRRVPLGKEWRDKVRAGFCNAGALGLLEELRDLKAGLGYLSSDYILQWPWLLITGTFWAIQQGAKQHEQMPLHRKGGRKSTEVDMHRDIQGHSVGHMCVGDIPGFPEIKGWRHSREKSCVT